MKRNLTILALSIILAVPAAYGLCGEDGHHAKAKAEHSCAADADAKHACAMKDKKVASRTDVELTGKVLCMHCNLHQEDECRKVFQAADEKLYDLCPKSDMKMLESLAEHGDAVLTIKGHVVKAEDGSEILMIQSAAKS